jgi:hypothetical protein
LYALRIPCGGQKGRETMFDFLLEAYLLLVEKNLPVRKGSKTARLLAEGIALGIFIAILAVGFYGQHLLDSGNEFGGTLCIGIAALIAVVQVIVAFCLKKD